MYAVVANGITQSIETGVPPEGSYAVVDIKPIFDPRYQNITAPLDPVNDPSAYTIVDGVVNRQWVVVSSWARVNQVITNVLNKTSWTQLMDAPSNIQTAYAAYRAAIRSIPTEYAADIESIIWPTEPTE